MVSLRGLVVMQKKYTQQDVVSLRGLVVLSYCQYPASPRFMRGSARSPTSHGLQASLRVLYGRGVSSTMLIASVDGRLFGPTKANATDQYDVGTGDSSLFWYVTWPRRNSHPPDGTVGFAGFRAL